MEYYNNSPTMYCRPIQYQIKPTSNFFFQVFLRTWSGHIIYTGPTFIFLNPTCHLFQTGPMAPPTSPIIWQADCLALVFHGTLGFRQKQSLNAVVFTQAEILSSNSVNWHLKLLIYFFTCPTFPRNNLDIRNRLLGLLCNHYLNILNTLHDGTKLLVL